MAIANIFAALVHNRSTGIVMASNRALDLIAAEVPHGSVIIEGGAGLYMEVTDTSDMSQWMQVSPATQADYDGLVVSSPLRKTGIAKASMDCAAFVTSPDQSRVAERTIDGRRFIHVATPTAFTPSSVKGGPADVLVNKRHVIGFDAGRDVAILTNADGHFVELVGSSSTDEGRILPSGCTLSHITLKKPWIVHLPTPTKTWFWLGKDVRSFQGPVTLPVQSSI
jgi:hypothetical protein